MTREESNYVARLERRIRELEATVKRLKSALDTPPLWKLELFHHSPHWGDLYAPMPQGPRTPH